MTSEANEQVIDGDPSQTTIKVCWGEGCDEIDCRIRQLAEIALEAGLEVDRLADDARSTDSRQQRQKPRAA